MLKNVGKFYGWTLVGIFFGIGLLNCAFPYYGASVLNTYMARSLDMDRSALGLGYSLFGISQGLSSPLVAFCLSRKGVRFTLSVGGIIIASGALLMAFVVKEAWEYTLVFGVIISAGVNFGGLIPIQAGVTYWFKRHKALAMSIALSAGGIGTTIAAPVLNGIVSSGNGDWRDGWLLVAVTSIVAAALTLAGVRNKPADLGQNPDGVNGEESDTPFMDGHRLSRPYQEDEPRTIKEALTTRSLWLIIAAAAAFLAPFMTCVAHAVIHLRDLGHTQEIAALSTGLLLLSSILGKFIGGLLGDRVALRLIWSTALCFVVGGIIVLANADSIGAVSLYAILVGGGFGAAYICMPTIIGDYFGPDSFARFMGLVLPIAFGGSAVAPWLAGIVYDNLGSYTVSFYGMAVLSLLGAILILFAHSPRSSGTRMC